MINDLWLIQKSTVEGIGDATKEKLGITEEIPVTEIENSIRSIPAQKPEQEKSFTISKNGSYTIEPDEGSVLTKVSVTENNRYESRWWQLFKKEITEIVEDDIISLTEYPRYMFGHCYNLTKVIFPSYITKIGARCFFACTKLGTTENLIIPATVKEIDEYAFGSCTGLTKVSIRGKPTSMASNAFSNCSNIANAYVSWGEGQVANEPWGLPSGCKIHWNYGS